MINKEKKFNDLLFYIVAAFKEKGVVETKLMKLLYFTEANYYKSNKKTVTGVAYFKNIYGPTPDVKVLDEAKRSLGKFLVVRKKKYNEREITVYEVVNKNYSYNFLTEKEMEEANRVIELYSRLPSDQLSKISHLDPPYLASDGRIDFSYVNYRRESEENCELPFTAEERENFNKDVSEDGFKKLFDYAGKKP